MSKTKEVLTTGERTVMEMAVKATMNRAADIVEKITEADVLDMQARLLKEGVSLENVARVDRALIASTHLRNCANGSLKQ